MEQRSQMLKQMQLSKTERGREVRSQGPGLRASRLRPGSSSPLLWSEVTPSRGAWARGPCCCAPSWVRGAGWLLSPWGLVPVLESVAAPGQLCALGSPCVPRDHAGDI